MPTVTKNPWSRFAGPALAAAASLLLVGGAPAAGTSADIAAAPESVDAARAELQKIEASITVSRDRADELKKEIEALDGDRDRQNAALIAAAQRVKMAEIEANAAEDHLSGLIASENDIRARLDGTDTEISHLLAALQRISKSPPPAILIDPDDALGSARGALLLADILPQLRAKAQSVASDLAGLEKVRQAAQDEEEALRGKLETLREAQLRTATLIAARKQGIARRNAELAEEERKAADLAARAKSLGDLVGSLSRNMDAGDADGAADRDSGPTALDPKTILSAFADTGRTAPAVPFPAARGFLTRPAAGVAVTRFGANDGFGSVSAGVSMITRDKAQVVAPADGWVLYKGPYLNYGQIVILNAGDGYSILMAGLDDIDVDIGQFVLMGEPVGRMGSHTVAQAIATSAGVSRPTLYIELRDHDTPLDPADWWADTDNRTQSG